MKLEIRVLARRRIDRIQTRQWDGKQAGIRGKDRERGNKRGTIGGYELLVLLLHSLFALWY